MTAARTWTHPDVLTRGVVEGWADPEVDPTRIDWAARRAVAAVPFRVVEGRPLSPGAPTGVRYGRGELGHWGEALAADAVVFTGDISGLRWLLMVERADGHGWAVPGGHVDPGEDPAAAAVRERAEETGLSVDLDQVRHHTLPVRLVPDPRATDEAWMVTVPTVIDLGGAPGWPVVVAADDAIRGAWIPATTYDELVNHLAAVYRGEVFTAHRDMVADILAADIIPGGAA